MNRIRALWGAAVTGATVAGLLFCVALFAGGLSVGPFYWMICGVGGALAGAAVGIGMMRFRWTLIFIIVLAAAKRLSIVVMRDFPPSLHHTDWIVGSIVFLLSFLLFLLVGRHSTL